MTVNNIIEICGGTRRISDYIQSVSQDAVRKWRKNAIPEVHWRALMELNDDLTPWILHDANEALRGKK